MTDVTVERRSAPRHAMVLAADVIELPRGAKLNARTADISLTGCYIDTLNPVPQGSEVRVRITHGTETFVSLGRVVYVSYGLGMGITFINMEDDQRTRLELWFFEPDREF
jgi:hypothetical protein